MSSTNQYSNLQIAKLLREIAAVYTIKKGNTYQIRAYESAADAIEHSTSQVRELWENNQLDDIPGVGESLKSHLDELFKTGKVKHWQDLKKGIPDSFFEFLDIPGVGPKTALELSDLKVKNIEDLKDQIKTGELIKKGFSGKIAEKIISGIEEFSSIKTGRMLLPYAFAQAEKVISYLKTSKDVKDAEVLGSLRRMVATIGDLDFAVSSTNPQAVVEHIIAMPGVSRVVDQGERKVVVMLTSGLHLDFLIGDPKSYGALLHHFTGSKHHNIHLRTIAENKGLSLSEDGVKNVKTGKIILINEEKEIYDLLNMDTPEPELRENTGEIEAAISRKLPKLITQKNIKGDLHIHSSFPLEPSHGPGVNNMEEIIDEAKSLDYQYIGISDHPPGYTTHSASEVSKLIQSRTKKIEQLISSNKSLRVLNLLEIDILPDGTLSVPDDVLKTLDFAIAGVHSSHHQEKEQITKRILKALQNPYVKVLSHPTGRLLNERDSYEADWEEVFKFASTNNKALEINSYPNRLDLADNLVHEAKKFGVKFVISTDSHSVDQMSNMKYGVSVARRGWCEEIDIINSWDWKKFSDWFKI